MLHFNFLQRTQYSFFVVFKFFYGLEVNPQTLQYTNSSPSISTVLFIWGSTPIFPPWKQPDSVTEMLNWDKYYATPPPSCLCCKRTFVYQQCASVRRHSNNQSARL